MLVGPHRVPESAFTMLAHGLADAQVMRMLRAGRLSKQILLVRAVLDASRGFHRATAAAGLDEALALIDDAQQAAPAEVASVIGHPLVGAWAAHCLRRLRHPAQTVPPLWVETAQLGAVAAAAGIRAGVEMAQPVPMRSGAVPLPTLGRARLPSAAAWGVATVRGRAGEYVVMAGHGTVALPVDPHQPAPGWEPVHRLPIVEAGRTLTVFLDDVDLYRGHGLAAAEGLDAGELARWRSHLLEAWTILVREHPERAHELAAGPITVVPLADRDGAPHVSATTRDSAGAMALSPTPDPFTMAMSLVHEFQHTKLGALLDLVELYDSGDHRRHYSPWRADPRPVGGLLQGAYAFLAVTRFWRRYAHGGTGPVSSRVAQFELARGRAQVGIALRELAGSGALTGPGHRFVAGLREAVEALASPPVAAEPGRLARLALEDHRVSWRLRNLQVDQSIVDLMASAWRSSMPRPTGHRPPRLVAAGPPTYAAQPLRDLAPLALDDPGALGPGVGTALATGDYETAARECLAAIRTEPGRLDLWTALAVARQRCGPPDAARAYQSEPELVVALYHRLVADGEAVHPDALAGWLAR